MEQPQAILLDAERAIKLHARPDKGRFGEDGLDIDTAVKIIEILRDELVKALAVDPTEVARVQGEIVSSIYERKLAEDHETIERAIGLLRELTAEHGQESALATVEEALDADRCEKCQMALTMVPEGGCGFDNCPHAED